MRRMSLYDWLLVGGWAVIALLLIVIGLGGMAEGEDEAGLALIVGLLMGAAEYTVLFHRQPAPV